MSDNNDKGEQYDGSNRSTFVFPLSISLFIVLCLFAVVLQHAFSENSAWSLYTRLKDSPDEKIRYAIRWYEYSVNGTFKDKPIAVFEPNLNKFQLGIYPSIAIAFVPPFIMTAFLKRHLLQSLSNEEQGSNFSNKIEAFNSKILSRTILCVVSFWASFFVFFGLNDQHVLYFWFDYGLTLSFSFLMGEIIYLNLLFFLHVRLLRQSLEKRGLTDKTKTLIDLEGKTWTQMLQLHVFLFASSLVGIFFAITAGYIEDIPSQITSSAEFNVFLTTMSFYLAILLGGMFAVLSSIFAHLKRVAELLMT